MKNEFAAHPRIRRALVAVSFLLLAGNAVVLVASLHMTGVL